MTGKASTTVASLVISSGTLTRVILAVASFASMEMSILVTFWICSPVSALTTWVPHVVPSDTILIFIGFKPPV